MLRTVMGRDISPQIYIAPRGLITILLFYSIPEALQLETFNSGIFLFVIIATSVIMTIAMIFDKRRSNKAIMQAKSNAVGYMKWKAKPMD